MKRREYQVIPKIAEHALISCTAIASPPPIKIAAKTREILFAKRQFQCGYTLHCPLHFYLPVSSTASPVVSEYLPLVIVINATMENNANKSVMRTD